MLEQEKEYFKHVDRSPQDLQIEAVPEHQAQPTSAAADECRWPDLEPCPGFAALLLSADRQTHGLIADAVPHRKVADEEHSALRQPRRYCSDKKSLRTLLQQARRPPTLPKGAEVPIIHAQTSRLETAGQRTEVWSGLYRHESLQVCASPPDVGRYKDLDDQA